MGERNLHTPQIVWWIRQLFSSIAKMLKGLNCQFKLVFIGLAFSLIYLLIVYTILAAYF